MGFIVDEFTVNLTNKAPMPDIDYINDQAIQRGFSLGTSFKDVPRILEDLYYLYEQERKDPLGFDPREHLFSSELIENEILHRPMNTSERAYYKDALIFLSEIDYSSVIGFTPMDKALRTMMYLVKLSDSTNPNEGRQGRYDTQLDPQQKNVTNVVDQQALSQAISEQAKNAEEAAMAGGQSDMSQAMQKRGEHNSRLKKEMTSCVRDHLYDLNPSIANVYGYERPADVPINKAILKDIQIKAYLEDHHGMETAKDMQLKTDNSSNQRQRKQMESFGQVTKIGKREIVKETFEDKFVKKELIVKEKVKPEEKKQILYMLLDDSGSMCQVEKQTYVRAVLLNRLEAVADGKAELHFSLYESKKYNYFHAKDKQTAAKLYRDISLRSPGGGGTHIGYVLQQTVNEIKEQQAKGMFYDPEIMIVCDGDDYINPEELDPKDVKINVVLLGTTNDNLEKVAKKTGGFYTVEKMYDRY